MNDYEYIASRITQEAALCQLAEEAAELAKAALKLRRAIVQDSPTPTTEEDARGNVLEEMADTLVAFRAWEHINGLGASLIVDGIAYVKEKRWVDRLKAAESKMKEGEENAEEDKQQAEGREI
jgi:hypothetical protein